MEYSLAHQRIAFLHGVVRSAAFSPDGSVAVAAGSLGGDSACVWDVASGTQIFRLKHEGEVCRAAFSLDGTKILTASQDGTARFWALFSGVELARFTHGYGLSGAVISADSASLLTWVYSDGASLWDTTSAIRRTGGRLVL